MPDKLLTIKLPCGCVIGMTMVLDAQTDRVSFEYLETDQKCNYHGQIDRVPAIFTSQSALCNKLIDILNIYRNGKRPSFSMITHVFADVAILNAHIRSVNEGNDDAFQFHFDSTDIMNNLDTLRSLDPLQSMDDWNFDISQGNV